jgi:hypothetical protein
MVSLVVSFVYEEKAGRTILVLVISRAILEFQVGFQEAGSFPRLRRHCVRVGSGSPQCSEVALSLLP